jgi:hypothetical protein
MIMSFEFPDASFTVDIDPRFAADLREMLATNAVQTYEVVRMLEQIAYFDEHRLQISGNYPGQTVVIGDQAVLFNGSQDEAFAWVAVYRDAAPVYLVTLPRPEQSGEELAATARYSGAVY